MWTAIVSLVLGIVKYLFGGRQAAEGEAQGKAEQAAQENASSARTQAAIAKAEATTDKTQRGIADAADHGEF